MPVEVTITARIPPEDIVPTLLGALGNAQLIEAELAMAASKTVYVPVETGNLRATGQVDEPEVSGSTVTVELGYGNTAVDYAVIVHEDPTKRHGEAIGKPAGQQYKFLEKAVLERVEGMEQRLADNVSRALR